MDKITKRLRLNAIFPQYTMHAKKKQKANVEINLIAQNFCYLPSERAKNDLVFEQSPKGEN
jgi:hypothetical protein